MRPACTNAIPVLQFGARVGVRGLCIDHVVCLSPAEQASGGNGPTERNHRAGIGAAAPVRLPLLFGSPGIDTVEP